MTDSEMYLGRHRTAVVLACLLGQSEAFQPSFSRQPLFQMATRNNVRLQESSSSSDGAEDPLSTTPSELGENTTEEDIAKSLFLKNSQENLAFAKDIFEGEEHYLGANDTSTVVGVLEEISMEENSSSSLDLPSSSDSVVGLVDTGVQSSIDVVLAASEAAAVAAEASLAEDLADQLAPFGHVNQPELDNGAVISLPTESSETDNHLEENQPLVAPSVARILKFAIPATVCSMFVLFWRCLCFHHVLTLFTTNHLSGSLAV